MSARPAAGLAAGGLAVVAVALVAALSAAPYTMPGSSEALLRLSWRTPSEPIEECRRTDPAEQARLPAHMRRERICERRLAPFHLSVSIDGRAIAEDTIRAAGARSDRPLYVFREFELGPGNHELAVTFAMIVPAGGGPTTPPAAMSVRRRLAFEPGHVILVTYDEDERGLVVRTGR